MITKTFTYYAEGIPKRPITWEIITYRVDIDTGELLTRHNAKTNYITINSKEYANITNYNKTRGQITRCIQYQRKAQLNLFD